MIAAVFGYIIGRALFGNRAALQILFFGFVLPLIGAGMFVLHVPAYVLQSVVGVVVAFVMLVGVKRRFFTVPGFFMHVLGFAGLVAAWMGFMHMPHIPAHHVHANPTLAWAGFDMMIVRSAAAWATVCYAILAAFYVGFVTMRQISMEFLFHKYVAWHADRVTYGGM